MREGEGNRDRRREDRQGEDHVKMDAENGVMGPQQRNNSNGQQLEEARNG